MAIQATQSLTLDEQIERRQAFLADTPWASAEVEPIVLDTSARQFIRLTKDSRTAILVDDSHNRKMEKFLFMQKKFTAMGLRVPEIYQADPAAGFAIEEDLGRERLFEHLQSGDIPYTDLYASAVEVLIRKARAELKQAAEGSELYTWEYWEGRRTDIYFDFYVPLVGKKNISPALRTELKEMLKHITAQTLHLDPVVLHGDFEPQNLFYLEQENGRCAMVDFQDATPAVGNMLSSPAFDMMALLRSARVPYRPDLEAEMKARFLKALPRIDRSQFEQEYMLLACLNHMKCLGLFAQFGIQNQRPEYLPFLANSQQQLPQILQHPLLKDVRRWFKHEDKTLKDI